MIFPFGKFKGYDYYDVPINYIVWAIENVDDNAILTDRLKEHLVERLDIYIPTRIVNRNKPIDVQSIYRQLSKQYHPDAGGNVEAMKAINEFMELLKKQL